MADFETIRRDLVRVASERSARELTRVVALVDDPHQQAQIIADFFSHMLVGCAEGIVAAYRGTKPESQPTVFMAAVAMCQGAMKQRFGVEYEKAEAEAIAGVKSGKLT